MMQPDAKLSYQLSGLIGGASDLGVILEVEGYRVPVRAKAVLENLVPQ